MTTGFSCAIAEQLILRESVEGLSSEEHGLLQRHLEGCEACAHKLAATGQAIESLRGISVPLPPALASRTQLRLYLRRSELHSKRRVAWVLWISCAASWVLGLATAPFVWRAFRWLGTYTGLPDPVWKMGVVLWWAVPALLAVAMLLLERSGERYDDVRL
jgi:anti-sigma factor RsiW